MPKRGCSHCRDKDVVGMKIQTFSAMGDSASPLMMGLGHWVGAVRPTYPWFRAVATIAVATSSTLRMH